MSSIAVNEVCGKYEMPNEIIDLISKYLHHSCMREVCAEIVCLDWTTICSCCDRKIMNFDTSKQIGRENYICIYCDENERYNGNFIAPFCNECRRHCDGGCVLKNHFSVLCDNHNGCGMINHIPVCPKGCSRCLQYKHKDYEIDWTGMTEKQLFYRKCNHGHECENCSYKFEIYH